MKKYLFFLIPAFILVIFAASCSKEDTQPAATTSPEGKWQGTGEYGTTGGNPTYVFTLTFKTNGQVDIIGNNSTGIDVAVGTWSMVQDTVKATYSYAGSSASHTLAAKYSAGASVMVGTIGLTPTTTGVGIFSVTKQ